MEKSKWDKVRKLLRSNAAAHSKQVDQTGLTALAVAVSLYAPLDIIKTIIEACPESTSAVDEFGATPLHLACLNGTNVDVVRLIMAHDDGQSIATPDHKNYTVLHHAVEYICILIENRYFGEDQVLGGSEYSIESEHQDYLEIIRIICRKCPQTVHFATKDNGDTPLDIPQIMMMRRRTDPTGKNQYHKRLKEVYQLLKEASIRVYRQKKHKWENEHKARSTVTCTTTPCEESVVSSLVSSLVSSVESQSQLRGSGNLDPIGYSR